MNKRVLKQKVARASEGLLNNLADLVLAQLFFGLLSMGSSKNSREIYRAAAEVERFFVLTPFSSFKICTHKKYGRVNYQKGTGAA